MTSGEIAFDRLHRLVGAGMKPQLGCLRDTTGVHLDYPSDRSPIRHVILFSDGTVMAVDKGLDIEPFDDERFVQLLKEIPRPNWIDRTQELRWKIAIYAFFIIAGWGLAKLTSMVPAPLRALIHL